MSGLHVLQKMIRDEIHALFVERFGNGSEREPTFDTSVSFYETEFQALLPESYVSFTKRHGSVVCGGMLDSIVDHELDLWDVMTIQTPQEAKECTEVYWWGGMPTDYVIFGIDSMGNAFCFEKAKVKKDDSAVFLFDHDFDKMKKLAEGFDLWLSQYIELIPNEK